MLSASFHSGSRGGSFVGPKRRLAAEELLQQFRRPPPVPAHMKVGSLSFEKDDRDQLSMTMNFTHEKQDAINISHRGPYHFTPLHAGSPYCAAKLGFLLLAVRGAFVLPGPQAFLEGNFTLKEEAKSWPLLCRVDHSTGQLKNNSPLKNLWDTFHSITIRSGFNSKMVTHHCNRAGLATNFIIKRSIERGGVFPQEDVPTLCRLAGWSENSGAWRLYVKDAFERNMDTCGLMYSDL